MTADACSNERRADALEVVQSSGGRFVGQSEWLDMRLAVWPRPYACLAHTDTLRLARLTLVRDGGARANPGCGAGLPTRAHWSIGGDGHGEIKKEILLLKWYI
jgi:hypothetical protein